MSILTPQNFKSRENSKTQDKLFLTLSKNIKIVKKISEKMRYSNNTLFSLVIFQHNFLSKHLLLFSLLSCVQLFVTTWTAAHQASLSFIISQSLLKRMSIDSVMPSNHVILCHPLLLPPSIFPSFRVFSSESALYIKWPKYWSFSFSISPFNEYSGLISFRTEISLQSKGLKSFLQHHSSKASILQYSAFFIVQLSDPNIITGKTTAFSIRTFVSKVMSLLFNMLSRFVIASLPKS